VPEGQLTQTFAWGSREDGLLFDKFAFGPIELCYTVGDLDAVRSSTGTCPPLPPPTPPAYTRTGPPLATGKEKFLGSAHSGGNASLNFGAYWNQVTPENGGKWGSAQPQSPFGPADQGYPTLPAPAFNFADAHGAEAQARANGHLFKWHTLFWGNQQPGWIETLPIEKQQEAIRIWLAAIAREFPNLEMIDVVNEPLHDPPRGATNGNYIEALGGDNGLYGTGWDWIIRAFELSREYFPNAKLVLNDYSITNDGNATTRYLQIIELLKARNLIDVVGIQAHAFEFNYNNLAQSAATHTANLARLKAAPPQRIASDAFATPYHGPQAPLVYWIDEVFSFYSPWSQDWENRKLEQIYYNTSDRAHLFWDQARLALNRSDREAIEVFYLALLLGFRGTVRDQVADVQDWREQFEANLGIHDSLSWRDNPPALPMPPTDVPPLTAKKRLRTFLIVLATLGMGVIGLVSFLASKYGVS
jgi:hypothetical protein